VGARVPRLAEWLELAAPDVVCLQETKVADGAFPVDVVTPLGYEVAQLGEGRWNGVAILSRVGLQDVVSGLPGAPGFPHAEARAIGATCGGVRVWSLYVPNGREPGHEHYVYKLAWLEVLRTVVAAELDGPAGAAPYALLGDFNVAPTDADVFDVAAFEGLTHVTPPEREAIAKLRALGLDDLMPRALKNDIPYTYWDYRGGNFHKNLGMRIDLVLANAAFSAGLRDAYVDRDARKGKGPSDHAPVVVDVDVA
jgi:exodeoxyribonuclease-3